MSGSIRPDYLYIALSHLQAAPCSLPFLRVERRAKRLAVPLLSFSAGGLMESNQRRQPRSQLKSKACFPNCMVFKGASFPRYNESAMLAQRGWDGLSRTLGDKGSRPGVCKRGM